MGSTSYRYTNIFEREQTTRICQDCKKPIDKIWKLEYRIRTFKGKKEKELLSRIVERDSYLTCDKCGQKARPKIYNPWEDAQMIKQF